MRRLALSVVAVVAALVLQLTLVDRLPLPGGGGPDLVLLVVVALGLTGSPMSGVLTGFWAGLALDIAPPASGVLGEHALVFCIVGYGCGRLGGLTDRSAAGALGVAAVAVAAAEMLYVAVGLMLGDPGLSWPAIRSVLPSAVFQDVLVSPFVVFVLWKAGSPAAGKIEGSLQAAAAGLGPARLAAGGTAPGPAGPGGRARWLTGPAGSGRSRKAGPAGSVRFGKSAGRPGDGWVGSGPRSAQPARAQAGRGRPLRLRPGSGQAGSAALTQARRLQPGRPVSLRMGQARRGPRGAAAAGSAAFRGAAFRGAAFRGAAFRGAAFRGDVTFRRGPAGRPYPLTGNTRAARRPRFRAVSGSPGGLAGRSGPRGPGSAGLGSAGLGSAGLGSAGRIGPGGTGPTRTGPGSAMRGSAMRGSAMRGSAMRGSRLRLGGAARSVRLRLRGRHGDGVVGGSALRTAGGRARFRIRRQPRFFRRRPGPSRGPLMLGRREPSFSSRQPGFPRRRPRLGSGRPSFMASRAGGGRGRLR